MISPLCLFMEALVKCHSAIFEKLYLNKAGHIEAILPRQFWEMCHRFLLSTKKYILH